jgi:hypothetical protein
MGLREEGLANGTVPKRRHQTGLSEQPNFPKFLKIKHDSTFSRRITYKTHDAITTCVCLGHDTRGTRDHENWFVLRGFGDGEGRDVHVIRVTNGCDTVRFVTPACGWLQPS